MNGEVQRVEIVPGDVDTISFFGTVAANSNVTLVSKRITVPFELQGITASFALNTNRTLQLEFFIAPDDSAPTDKPLHGFSVLSELGQVEYLTGDDDSKKIPMRVAVRVAGMFMKVFATNTDSFAHTIDVQMFIHSKKRLVAKPAPKKE